MLEFLRKIKKIKDNILSGKIDLEDLEVLNFLSPDVTGIGLVDSAISILSLATMMIVAEEFLDEIDDKEISVENKQLSVALVRDTYKNQYEIIRLIEDSTRSEINNLKSTIKNQKRSIGKLQKRLDDLVEKVDFIKNEKANLKLQIDKLNKKFEELGKTNVFSKQSSLDKIRLDAKELIGKNRVERSIDFLASKLRTGHEKSNSLLLLKSRFCRNEEDEKRGVLSRIDYSQSLNKITISLISLIDDIDEKDIA